MIKPGEADSRRARDVAHRSSVIAFLGKNTRRGTQDQFKLLIVTRKVCFGGGGHRLAGSADVPYAGACAARLKVLAKGSKKLVRASRSSADEKCPRSQL